MKSTDNRRLFDTLIGASAATGNIATIPATQGTAGDGTASIALAFPPETFIARSAGGEPPRGADMNGFLNLLSSAVQVLQAGYLGPFDAAFAAGIGGYPAGAIVSGSAAGTFWVSTADANTTVPGAAGASWKSLFDGYATQAWAAGQFVMSAPADANNAGAAYLGVNTTLGYPWLNYMNSSGNLALVILADRTWVNGNFSTITSLNAEATTRLNADNTLQTNINTEATTRASAVTTLQTNITNEATTRANADTTLQTNITNEATTRANADTALSTAITNEVTRATGVEAQKANLAGGNSWSGTQNFSGNAVIAGGYYLSVANSAAAGSMYSWPEYYTSGNLTGINAVTHVLNSSGTSLSWMALRGSDGSVWTSGGGQLAYVSQLPTYGTITGGYYVKIGNILIQYFTATVPNGGGTVSFPMAYASAPTPPLLTPHSGGATLEYHTLNTTATTFDISDDASGTVGTMTYSISVMGIA